MIQELFKARRDEKRSGSLPHVAEALAEAQATASILSEEQRRISWYEWDILMVNKYNMKLYEGTNRPDDIAVLAS